MVTDALARGLPSAFRGKRFKKNTVSFVLGFAPVPSGARSLARAGSVEPRRVRCRDRGTGECFTHLLRVFSPRGPRGVACPRARDLCVPA